MQKMHNNSKGEEEINVLSIKYCNSIRIKFILDENMFFNQLRSNLITFCQNLVLLKETE